MNALKNNLKAFPWKVFLALCLLALVPAIYQTIITRLITTRAEPGALDVVGQMEWFDLIDETICAFLVIPMYSLLGKAIKGDDFPKKAFKLGILVVGLYALFTIGVFFYGIHIVRFMNPNEVNVGDAYAYLSLETIAFMIGIAVSYVNVVFLTLGKTRNMYAFLIAKLLLSLLADLALVPALGATGIAVGNIIANSVLAVLGVILLTYETQLQFAKFDKSDVPFLKDWVKTGLFAGGQQFLDNIIYALMIVRMVNAVSESGNYWVANNFIWGWLLIPISALSEVIRASAAKDGYRLHQSNYYIIAFATIALWFALIPTYQWFFGDVEGIKNPGRIFEIVVKNLGFYVAYALSQIPDAIFVGMGKTKYNAVNSLFCNIVYYGIWFILYQTKAVTMDMDMIIVMFGLGNVTHWAISILEEKLFLKRELAKAEASQNQESPR